MKITLVDTEDGFDGLRLDWNRLAEKTSTSYFSSFDFVRAAWRHFRQPSDRLLILVISDSSTPVGIAPFYVYTTKKMGIPFRVVSFIAMCQGDRPEILAHGDTEEVWRQIISFLFHKLRAWEILDLGEQPVDGPLGKGWDFLFQPGVYWTRMEDAVNYYVPLEGSFDVYLEHLSANTRSHWRRKTRRLSESVGGFDVEYVSEPDRIIEGLHRFIRVERLGWKVDAGVALAQDDTQIAFYQDIVSRLAATGEASICFLRSNEADIAALINFFHRDIAYMRHTTYDPAYAKFSPGIVLLAEVIRRLFGGRYKEYDLLGMRRDRGSQRYKLQWGRGERRTIQWLGYRVRSRLFPWLVFKRLKPLFTGDLPGA